MDSRSTVLNTFSEEDMTQRLGISRVTAWRLRRDGKLAYYRVGRSIRYSEQHIAEYLASCERRRGKVNSSQRSNASGFQ